MTTGIMTKTIIANYFKTQPVLKAWFFGSCSQGEQTKDKDVMFFVMLSDLEELLGRKVDLVSEGTLLPFAKESAEKDKILIYERGK